MIKLGEKVKDTITDFEGVAVGKVEYLYGCKQIQIEGVNNDLQPKSYWFDEQRVVISEETAEEPPYERPSGYTGGTRDAPIGRGNPPSMTFEDDD